MITLRLYLGQLDSDFIEVQITNEQYQKMLVHEKVNIDDGGVRFTELILDYVRK